MALEGTFTILVVFAFLGAILRLVALRFFHEPKRADVAVASTLLALFIGSLLPFSWHMRASALGRASSVTVPSTSPRTATCSESDHRDNSFRNKTLLPQRSLFASLDSVSIDGAPPIRLTRGVPISTTSCIELYGWAKDPDGIKVASLVVLLIDGIPTYRFSPSRNKRPDVASYFHDDLLADSSFSVSLSAKELGQGEHFLGMAVMGVNNGPIYLYKANVSVLVQ